METVAMSTGKMAQQYQNTHPPTQNNTQNTKPTPSDMSSEGSGICGPQPNSNIK